MDLSPGAAAAASLQASRRRRACTNCVRIKCKCIPCDESEKGSGSSCQRCHRLKKECLPATSEATTTSRTTAGSGARQPRISKGKGKRISRTQQIEAKINDLVDFLRTSSASSANSALLASLSQKQPHGARDSGEAGEAGEASETNETGEKEQEEEQQIPELHPYYASGPLPAVASFQPRRSPDDDMYDSDPLPDEAERIFVHFRDDMLIHDPFVYFPPETTAAKLRQEAPFMWRSIMAVASPSPASRRARGGLCRRLLIDRVISAGERTLGNLHALLILSNWFHVIPSPGIDNALVCLITQTAACVACDLGLTIPPLSAQESRVSCVPPPQKTATAASTIPTETAESVKTVPLTATGAPRDPFFSSTSAVSITPTTLAVSAVSAVPSISSASSASSTPTCSTLSSSTTSSTPPSATLEGPNTAAIPGLLQPILLRERTMIERRALLGTFSVTCGYPQKPDGLRWTPYMEDCAVHLATQLKLQQEGGTSRDCNASAASDAILLRMARLRRLAHQLRFASTWATSVTSPVGGTPYRTYGPALLNVSMPHLESVMAYIDSLVAEPGAMDHYPTFALYHYTRLVLYEPVLARAAAGGYASDLGSGLTGAGAPPPSFCRLTIYERCLESGQAFVEALLAQPAEKLIMLPCTIICLIFYVLSSMHRLSMVRDDPMWNRDIIQRSAPIIGQPAVLLDRVQLLVEQGIHAIHRGADGKDDDDHESMRQCTLHIAIRKLAALRGMWKSETAQQEGGRGGAAAASAAPGGMGGVADRDEERGGQEMGREMGYNAQAGSLLSQPVMAESGIPFFSDIPLSTSLSTFPMPAFDYFNAIPELPVDISWV